MGKLRTELGGEEMVQKIIGTLVGFNNSLQDTQIWKSTANGVLTVKTAYNMLFFRQDWSDPLWEFMEIDSSP